MVNKHLLTLLQHNTAYDEAEILSRLPFNISRSILLLRHKDTIQQINIFKYINNESIVLCILQRLVSVYFERNNQIYIQNENATGFYIVVSGRIVLIKDPTKVKPTMQETNHLHHDLSLRSNNETASVDFRERRKFAFSTSYIDDSTNHLHTHRVTSSHTSFLPMHYVVDSQLSDSQLYPKEESKCRDSHVAFTEGSYARMHRRPEEEEDNVSVVPDEVEGNHCFYEEESVANDDQRAPSNIHHHPHRRRGSSSSTGKLYEYLYKGDVLGLEDIVYHQQYQATAKTVKPSGTFFLDIADINELMKDNPAVALELQRALAQYLIEKKISHQKKHFKDVQLKLFREFRALHLQEKSNVKVKARVLKSVMKSISKLKHMSSLSKSRSEVRDEDVMNMLSADADKDNEFKRKDSRDLLERDKIKDKDEERDRHKDREREKDKGYDRDSHRKGIACESMSQNLASDMSGIVTVKESQKSVAKLDVDSVSSSSSIHSPLANADVITPTEETIHLKSLKNKKSMVTIPSNKFDKDNTMQTSSNHQHTAKVRKSVDSLNLSPNRRRSNSNLTQVSTSSKTNKMTRENQNSIQKSSSTTNIVATSHKSSSLFFLIDMLQRKKEFEIANQSNLELIELWLSELRYKSPLEYSNYELDSFQRRKKNNTKYYLHKKNLSYDDIVILDHGFQIIASLEQEEEEGYDSQDNNNKIFQRPRSLSSPSPLALDNDWM